MKIVVDADACPVKEEIVQVAARFETPVIMVASYAHVLPEQQGVTVVQVDRSLQAADLYISNRLCPKDVLVTDDYGLATIGLAREATVVSFRGHLFSEQRIGFMLERRHALSRSRRGGMRIKGPRSFNNQDRTRFLHTLTKVLQDMQEI